MKWLICCIYFFLITNAVIGGRVKRCFVCRSRGDLGDCKDPFPYNATTVESLRGVEAIPCASSWCAKIIEGKKDDYATATERMCLQRPPGDSEERCSNTLYKHHKVFMCFCRGDLCNSASNFRLEFLLLLPFWVIKFLNCNLL
ncbi:UPAR/Ly6 domain-containing protein rtv [Centruroides vittatus]|uniref:UPAR/Ly6 domain-containing protein rtv n=1 Tax=Centruroides vittatus TaxID=120091 RepID=UPI00350FCB05